ncbi:MAG: sodium:solute symporter family protein [Bacteroidota bacterium]
MTLPPITIDTLIFVVFLLLNIIVGFRYRGKRQSFKEYAIGNKQFSTATLTATIVATWMSGGALFISLENIHKHGLYYSIADIIGTTLCLVITGYVVGPRMGRFLNNLSVPETLGKLYGKPVQVISGIATVLRSTGYMAMQLQIIARILAILFNYKGPEVVTIVSIIVTLYALSGGVKAVTFTDVLQFFTFGTLLPLLALTIWNSLQDPGQVTHMLQTHPQFSFEEAVKWSPEFRKTMLFMVYLMVPILQPQLFQRMVMAQDTAQIKRSFGYAAIVCLGIELCIMWIAIMTFVDQPGPEADKIMRYIVNTNIYPGLKGLLGIGVIALSMSTADSVLNCCAVITTNDILLPLGLQKERSLRTAKWSTLILGTLGLVVALSARDLFQVLLGATNFYIPSVAPAPILLAIFGFQTSSRVVLIAMGAGATTTMACHLYFKDVHSFLPGMLANMITMIVLHYLLGEKGGWQSLPPDDPLALERTARKQAWKWRLNVLRNFKLYPYLKQNLPTQERFYTLFGLYTLAVTYIALCTIKSPEDPTYRTIYTGIYHTVLPLTTVFLIFSIWPNRLKRSRIIVFFWPLCIGGILFFAGTLLVMLSNFHYLQVMSMMINLLMAVLLLQWPLALFLALTGIYAAVFCFTHWTGTPLLTGALGSMQMVCLFVLFTSLALKGKQVYRGLFTSYVQLREEMRLTNQMFLSTMRFQVKLQQEASLRLIKAADADPWTTSLHTSPQHLTRAQLMASYAASQKRIYELDTLNKHLQQVLHLAQEPIQLTVENIVLATLWQDILKTLYQHQKIIIQQTTAIQSIQGDSTKIKKLLLAAASYAAGHQKSDRPLLIGIKDTQLAYPLMSIPGYVKRIQALCIIITTASTLPTVKKLYIGSVDELSLRWPQNLKELTITYNQQIVAAHYGATELISTATEMTQVYVLPQDVRAVRPPTMDQWQTAAPSEMTTAEAAHPAEKHLVWRILAKTQMKRELLQEALQIIKQYHTGKYLNTTMPAYLHPIAVASILLTYTQDPNTLLAALLHDIIDTTHLSWHSLALRFNPAVKRIVEGVASVDSRLHSFKKVQLSPRETIFKLMEVKDERVLYVKLADQLHHARMIASHSVHTQQKNMAAETLRFYVPLATHLGLQAMAEEMRQLCLRFM